MKKAVLILLGIALLVVGIGVRYVVDSDPDIDMLNEYLVMFGGVEISPKLVGKLLDGEMNLMGYTVTVDDLLEMTDTADADQLRFFLRLYASSTLMAIAGGVLTVLGLALPKRSA